MTTAPRLRQESVVAIGDREVSVVSEVLLEPEGLIVTRVLSGTDVMKKSHVLLPAAALRDLEREGPGSLAPTLQSFHLRYVAHLLSGAPEAPAGSDAVRSGTLAVLTLGASGEVLQRAGEDQVPGGWLRSAFLVSGMCDALSAHPSLGPMRRGVMQGEGLVAVLARDGRRTKVTFFDGDAPLSTGRPRAS